MLKYTHWQPSMSVCSAKARTCARVSARDVADRFRKVQLATDDRFAQETGSSAIKLSEVRHAIPCGDTRHACATSYFYDNTSSVAAMYADSDRAIKG